MKDIFLTVCALLQTIPALKWIDMDYGQLEAFDVKPSVPFPCALVKIELQECKSIGGKLQNCTALITIKLGWDFFMTETTPVASPDALARSLAVYDTADAVYTAMEGFYNAQVNELERMSLRQSSNKANNTILIIPFNTTFTDETAC